MNKALTIAKGALITTALVLAVIYVARKSPAKPIVDKALAG